MIVEKSTLLKKLELRPRHPTDDHCYRWTTQLQIETGIDIIEGGMFDSSLRANHGNQRPLVPDIPSMVCYRSSPPRWPHLVKVSLSDCRVDHLFLPVLVDNAPALEDFSLFEVVVRQAKTLHTEANVFDCSSIQDSLDERMGGNEPFDARETHQLGSIGHRGSKMHRYSGSKMD